MEKEYELLDLSYLRESFGEEFIPEMLKMGIHQQSEFVGQLTEIKHSGKYYKQHGFVYSIGGGTVIILSKPDFDLKLELRKYLLFGYFKKASSVFELKEIHKFLIWYLNNKDSRDSIDKGKEALVDLLMGTKKEFLRFCSSIDRVNSYPHIYYGDPGDEITKYHYYDSILNEMFNIASDSEMITCFEKYDKLAQESLDKLIAYISKLNDEILHYMKENGIDPNEPIQE